MARADCAPCDGSGWRRVQAKYAEHQASLKVPRELDVEWTAAHEKAWRSAYETALNSVYPCKDCNTEMFWRWANGHLDREHDRASCAECIALGVPGSKKRHSGRSSRAADRPPPTPEPQPPAWDDLEATAP